MIFNFFFFYSVYYVNISYVSGFVILDGGTYIRISLIVNISVERQ